MGGFAFTTHCAFIPSEVEDLMSVLMTITCESCEKDKEVNGDPNNPPRICSDCAITKKEVALEEHLAACEKLSIWERLKKLEKALYLMQQQADPSFRDMRF
tara:strand:+ start:399691 stop:399993 length:303 start_codon:yes stop_codon:yes gene_type:complete